MQRFAIVSTNQTRFVRKRCTKYTFLLFWYVFFLFRSHVVSLATWHNLSPNNGTLKYVFLKLINTKISFEKY